MNVLDEILISYLVNVEGKEIPSEDWEEVVDEIVDEIGYGKYSYLVQEVMDRDYNGKWFKDSYPEDVAWAETNGYKRIEQDGGGEGGAEYCEMVFSWKEKFYHISYSYYSHQGYYFEEVQETITEVHPVQKMVTVYE